jgi:hypothetical protein
MFKFPVLPAKESEAIGRIWYDFRIYTIQWYCNVIPFHNPKTQLSELLHESKIVNFPFFISGICLPRGWNESGCCLSGATGTDFTSVFGCPRLCGTSCRLFRRNPLMASEVDAHALNSFWDIEEDLNPNFCKYG